MFFRISQACLKLASLQLKQGIPWKAFEGFLSGFFSCFHFFERLVLKRCSFQGVSRYCFSITEGSDLSSLMGSEVYSMILWTMCSNIQIKKACGLPGCWWWRDVDANLGYWISQWVCMVPEIEKYRLWNSRFRNT